MENARFLWAISDSLQSVSLEAAICLRVKEPKWGVKDMEYLWVPASPLVADAFVS